MTRQVYIYGLGGADKMYRVLAYHSLRRKTLQLTILYIGPLC